MDLRGVLLFSIIIINPVTCQVCNKTISVHREVPVTYQYTFYEAYQDDECIMCCTKSRQATNIGTRLVTKVFEETTSICCEGYTEDNINVGDGLQCIPVCSPPCLNGYCRKPNECACEWGFAIDPNDNLNRCVPLCLEGCDLPDCLPTCAPQNFGILEPLEACKNCNNGSCTAPGKCQCDEGFKLKVDGGCEPICSSCEHGTCLRSGLCACDSGWREQCGSCRPVCSDCEHGNCTAPDRCECDVGYQSDDGKCIPFCSNGCVNGSCISPEICSCDPGWYLNEEAECLPHCDAACGNGSCVAPNVCLCHSGYGGPLCEPICSNCDDSCIAPEVCQFDVQFDTTHSPVNESGCNCFDCFDASRICDNCSNRSDNGNVDKIERINKSQDVTVGLDNSEFIPVEFSNITQFIDIKDSANDTRRQHRETAAIPYHWIYGAIMIAELLIIIILMSIMKRKHYFKQQFVPKHTFSEAATVRYTHSFK